RRHVSPPSRRRGHLAGDLDALQPDGLVRSLGRGRRARMLRKWAALARKAAHRPPAFVMRRAVEEMRRQAYRPWGRIRPLLLTDKALLDAVNSPSIDELWERLLRTPFPLATGAADTWTRRFS